MDIAARALAISTDLPLDTAVFELVHGGKTALPSLLLALRSSDAHQRQFAAFILAQHGGSAFVAVPLLKQLLERDPDDTTRFLAALALGEIGDRAAIPSLEKALQDTSADVGLSALQALANFGPSRRSFDLAQQALQRKASESHVAPFARLAPPEALPALEEWASTSLTEDNIATRVIAYLPGESGRQALHRLATSPRAIVRRNALAALAEVRHPSDAIYFLSALSDGDASVRAAAASGLGAVRATHAVERLGEVARSDREPVASAAIKGLLALKTSQADEMIATLYGSSPSLAAEIVRAIAAARRYDLSPILSRGIEHTDTTVRLATITASGTLHSFDTPSILLQASRDHAPEIRAIAISQSTSLNLRPETRRTLQDTSFADPDLRVRFAAVYAWPEDPRIGNLLLGALQEGAREEVLTFLAQHRYLLPSLLHRHEIYTHLVQTIPAAQFTSSISTVIVALDPERAVNDLSQIIRERHAAQHTTAFLFQALLNIGTAEASAVVRNALVGEDPLLSLSARVALYRERSRTARELLAPLQTHPREDLQRFADMLLAPDEAEEYFPAASFPTLSVDQKVNALRESDHQSIEGLDILFAGLADTDRDVRRVAQHVLRTVPPSRIAPRLVALSNHRNEAVQIAAADLLVQSVERTDVQLALSTLLKDESPLVRMHAARAVATGPSSPLQETATAILQRGLEATSAVLREIAVLGTSTSSENVIQLVGLFTAERNPEVRAAIEKRLTAMKADLGRSAISLNRFLVDEIRSSGRGDLWQLASVLERAESFKLIEPLRYSSDQLTRIVETREAFAEGKIPSGRNLTLYVAARGDATQAFHRANTALDPLFGLSDVLVFHAGDEPEFVEAFQALIDRGVQADGLITIGHGNPRAFDLGGVEASGTGRPMFPDNTVLNISDLPRLRELRLDRALKNSADVVIVSCLNAEGLALEENMARFWRELFANANSVLAATDETQLRTVGYEDGHLTAKFIGTLDQHYRQQ